MGRFANVGVTLSDRKLRIRAEMFGYVRVPVAKRVSHRVQQAGLSRAMAPLLYEVQ